MHPGDNTGTSVIQICFIKSTADLFMKMWIFIHGAACMSLTGDYDLTDLQTMQLLEHSYYAFYNETTRG